MKRGWQSLRNQGGFALWLLLVALIFGLSYGLLKASNGQSGQLPRDAALAARLLQTKAALLARAVNDQNRPGSLPCPDLVTNSQEMNNFPGDGKADMLAGNHCPSYVGWLPWLTLDQPELTDDTGNHFWYALSPSLRDDDSAQPINATTPGSLEVDGQTDIAAIIIAPGAALTQQQRPTNNVADYLEAANGLSDKYVSTSPGTDFNDRLITISRDELMAAVGKRVAGELRACLEQHADASTNSEHRYPWPAPFPEANRHGTAGSRFGRVATSQPGSGPEAALAASLDKLEFAQQQLASNTDSKLQLHAQAMLEDAALLARNLLEGIFTTSKLLKFTAEGTGKHLQPVLESIATATENNRISRSEGIEIRNLGDTADVALDTLPRMLGEFGFDPFSQELALRRARLADSPTPAATLGNIAAMRDLLDLAHSPRLDLAPALAASKQAITNATQATQAWAATPGNNTLHQQANTSIKSLIEASTVLEESISASRINVLASEIDDFSSLLENARNTVTPTTREVLLDALVATRNATASIDTGIVSVKAARDASIDALSTAILLAQSPSSNTQQIDVATTQAITLSQALSADIASNEAVDNNLTRTSLLEAIRNYRTTGAQFAALDTATPRPLQSDIVHPAEALGESATKILFWLQIISAHSTSSAQSARATPQYLGTTRNAG